MPIVSRECIYTKVKAARPLPGVKPPPEPMLCFWCKKPFTDRMMAMIPLDGQQHDQTKRIELHCDHCNELLFATEPGEE